MNGAEHEAAEPVAPATGIRWKTFAAIDENWAMLLSCTEAQARAVLVAPPASIAVRFINGAACTSVRRVHREWARALEFPNYYGHNWDALFDCLSDLDWISANGYTVVILNANLLLCRHPNNFRTLVGILGHTALDFRSSATDEVTERPKAFHVVWHCELHTRESLLKRLAEHGVRPREI